MKKHWRFSKHFAERVFERVAGDYKLVVDKICREFNDTVLEKVFHCVLYGASQRVAIDNYFVCYTFDDHAQQLVITTIY
jgi:hypothetical protein